jgi:hypothetical protein
MNFPGSRFLIFGALLCLGLATANHRGYGVWHAVAYRAWNHFSPGPQHK